MNTPDITAKKIKKEIPVSHIGFMPHSFVQASLPYSARPGHEWIRKAGKYTLVLYGPEGLPYGSIPRLVMSWITTEAVRTKSRDIVLGDSLSDFLSALGLHRTGGKRGDITRLRKQISLLFSCFISLKYDDHFIQNGLETVREDRKNMVLVDSSSLIWQPTAAGRSIFSGNAGKSASIRLSESFFNEITSAPVPFDMEALKQFCRSPMALDLYMWLAYRLSYLKSPVTISWEQLSVQFGANYTRTRAFKEAFLDHMKTITGEYSEIRYVSDPRGFTLFPLHTSLSDIENSKV